MRIATWNVNSVKARHDRLLAFLERWKPDVVCLQETKVQDDVFPSLELRGAGYHAAVHGQKTYNGVAILSREPVDDVRVGLGDDVDDPQARLISARVGDARVLSVYVPNGSTPESDKFQYKLAWLDRLERHVKASLDAGDALVLCGDLNIAPTDLDVRNVDAWRDTVLCVPQVRAAFARLTDLGLVDCFRKLHPEEALYSWWDYRRLGFPKNDGVRIDHVLATEGLAARCTEAVIDRQERKGKLPSDHAPVLCDFQD